MINKNKFIIRRSNLFNYESIGKLNKNFEKEKKIPSLNK